MRIIIIIRVDSRLTMDRAAEMIISHSPPIIVRVMAARAIQIPTTTRPFNRKLPFSYNTKRRIRLRSLPWILTTLSTVIRQAYQRQRVRLCSLCTVSKARPFSHPWTFKTPTTTPARALETETTMRQLQPHPHHRNESVLWILKARRTSCEHLTPYDSETLDFAKVNCDFLFSPLRLMDEF